MQRAANVLAVLAVLAMASGAMAVGEAPKITQGTLRAVGPENKPLGDCPLEHTDVQVSVSGFVAYVQVTQKFANPFKDKIEAVYTFPLGVDAAVTDMTMKVGDRVIRGQIKPREEARQIYEQAKAKGHVASLLDQERPNIFTQWVANIEPGKRIDITISYTELLKYADGRYEFVFPMVVGPRYIPGDTPSSPAKGGTGWGRDTTAVPDASRITPPVAPEGQRAGHDISVKVYVNAGMEIKLIESRQHEVATRWPGKGKQRAIVELAQKKTIPNKDFVLSYATVQEGIGDTILMHVDGKKGGFFTLILEPPKKIKPAEVRPRELVFVIDSSGSMSGFPIETAKEVMARCIRNLRPRDTLNLITFAGHTTQLWEEAVANTEANRDKALAFLKDLKGGGGTEMMKAIHACLGGRRDPERTRIVCFMTDAYVGNDMAIVNAVRNYADKAHVFSFGIGTSVNRYLLDNMARAGRGEVEYVLDAKQAPAAAKRFYDRIDAPVLGDVRLDWGELGKYVDAEEVYPRHVPDLFSVKPLVIKGRFQPGAEDVKGTLTIRGVTSTGPFERRVPVTLPAAETANGVMMSQWARSKVDYLMDQDLLGAQSGKPDAAIKERIVGLGVTYRLLTQYTSFVAVEEKVVTVGGEPRTVAVPVEMPEGVSHEGVFGPGHGRGWGGGCGRKAGGGWAAPVASYCKRIEPADKSDELASSASRLVPGLVAGIKADKQLTDEQKKAKVVELKLAKVLQGLAAKLDGDGNYSAGKVVVKGGKIEVAVYLYQMDDKALAELKKLGFVKLLDSKAVKMVMGTIEVKKLADLAWLDAVRRVDLPSFVK